MEFETANWLIGTIAQITAVVIGFVVISTVFFVDQMSKFRSEHSNYGSYRMLSRIIGIPAKRFLQLLGGMIIGSLILGVLVISDAMGIFRRMQSVIDDNILSQISNLEFLFLVFILLAGFSAIALVWSSIDFTLYRLKEDETKEGGNKEVKRDIQEYQQAEKEKLVLSLLNKALELKTRPLPREIEQFEKMKRISSDLNQGDDDSLPDDRKDEEGG